jgi:hypothetical protein
MVGWFGYFLLLLVTLVVIPGCTSRYDRVVATRPDGGISREIHHSFDIVFSSVVRVMHNNKETIDEAVQKTGRIVSLSPLISKAIFLRNLPNGATRVELSASMSRPEFGAFPGGPDAFFAQLKEQITEFEKKRAQRKQLAESQVDPDLRRIYLPQKTSTQFLVCPECVQQRRIPYGRTVIKQRGLP